MELSKNNQIIITVIIILIITIIGIYSIHIFTGWTSFTMQKGQNFKYNDLAPELVSKLKFRKCIFKIQGNNGDVKETDVASVLNVMVSAYKNNENKGYIFKLDDPGLSIYSFQIPGFNDGIKAPNPDIWSDDDSKSNVTLEGYYKI